MRPESFASSTSPFVQHACAQIRPTPYRQFVRRSMRVSCASAEVSCFDAIPECARRHQSAFRLAKCFGTPHRKPNLTTGLLWIAESSVHQPFLCRNEQFQGEALPGRLYVGTRTGAFWWASGPKLCSPTVNLSRSGQNAGM